MIIQFTEKFYYLYIYMSENGDEQNTNEGTGELADLQASTMGGLLQTNKEEEEEQNENNVNNEEEENNNENEEDKNDEDNKSHRSSQQSKQSQRSRQTQSQRSQQSRQSKQSQNSKVHEPDGRSSNKRSSNRGTSNSSRTQKSSTSKKKSYDVKEVTALSTSIYAGEPITTTDTDLIAAAILDLQDMRYQLECEGKFDEALQAVQAIDRARGEQKEIIKKIYSNEEVENVNQKIESSQNQLNRLNKKAEIRTNQLNYDLDELVENLRKRQQTEIENHDKEWESESKIRDYNRASGKVRALRYQQQKMLNAKRYAEAEQVRKIADNVVRMEAMSASQQMKNEYQASLELLLKKHQEEMDNLLAANEARRAQLQHAIEKRRAPILLRISQLENEKRLAGDEDRVWNLRYKTDSASISKRMGMTSDANVQSARLRIPDYNTMPLPPLKTGSLRKSVMSKKSQRL